MVRTPSCDKSGLRKGTWTPEEDKKLIAYVTRYGSWNWRQLPRFAGLARCGKSCRLRWLNYLRPDLKRGNFTQEEEECIIRLHKKLGNRWSLIAAELPGRTDNEVKNHWHTALKKRTLENNTTTNEKAKASEDKDSVPNNDGSLQVTPLSTSMISDNTCPLSPLSSSSEFSSITSDHTNNATTSNEMLVPDDAFSFLDENFWSEPFISEICYTPSETVLGDSSADSITANQTSSANSDLDNNYDIASFLDAQTETVPIIENDFWTEPYVADVSHVPSEFLTPFSDESGYFSPLCGADLWSHQSTLYDEHDFNLF